MWAGRPQALLNGHLSEAALPFRGLAMPRGCGQASKKPIGRPPYLLDALISRRETARPLDIALLLAGQFRSHGVHLKSRLRESRRAGPHNGRRIC